MSTLPSSCATLGDPRLQRGAVGDVDGRAGRLHAHRLQLGNGAGDLIRVAGAHRDVAPSPASVSAIARPMPRVPPSTTAFRPFNPRSILFFPLLMSAHCSGEDNPGESGNRRRPSRIARSDWSAVTRTAMAEAIRPAPSLSSQRERNCARRAHPSANRSLPKGGLTPRQYFHGCPD